MTEDKKLKQRVYRKNINNQVTKKYEKTKKGFLVRVYRNMKSRIIGIQYLKAHLYKNKELLSKNIFYTFSLDNLIFHTLFDNWEKSGYDRKICPSIDRINSDEGYTLNNIRWITHSENSKLGRLKKKKL